MVSVDVKDLGLRYRLQKRFSLAPGRQQAKATGGAIMREGGSAYVQALDGISFSLKAGDRLGLVGSNGAGKTTLLKVLYGIYEPTSGTVDVEGRVDALFNIRLGFRAGASGRRNIELRCLINGWTPEQISDRIDEIVEFSELGDFIDLPLKSYSQGMAARLAFAVATATEPEVLLMDEWIGAGDPEFQEKAKARMQEITEEAGIIVLASHNKNLIQKSCNKVLHLEKGKLRSLLSVEEWANGSK
ncbi:ABC transporter ATP-binding protein [Nitratireductor aquimarinus]|uniref:ABC transporter ATP-binding protein n=1 Tax=Alphaproteobacteria TaxID=28211 RepID=UPI0019D331AD|nr:MULTISPECIES: ABC transporter ATP-binding protein [Alphaproteobacteria]MBN7755707.1 ABC transporter ATP-binding protein [Nitratireductor aquimarinus]MBY5998461.1 ABC transporter ATP-binding protein [Tritonibacter mobilis]MBY6020493.1 ABC transporter ATP-binding protein [Nitratireductor sp. DP7N14-4]MCV0379432.1 ABC transporter ATP-binding protein [Nitratireductor sp.]